MSALVVIVCDMCRDRGAVGSTPQQARAELRSWARRQGMDLCPLCRLLVESQDRMSNSPG
ncbi:MAG TPA: hypothetical protein VK895_07005 [Jiangellaceae bacterium]|nr:hypothetical protein [Jiangellaceae bacterium]